MKKFALEHNLTARLMTSVAKGKYKHHKGWTIVTVEKLSEGGHQKVLRPAMILEVQKQS